MRQLQCEIVTAERRVYAGEVKEVIAPTTSGQVGILPMHAPLLSELGAGEIRLILPDDDELLLAVAGGFMEVRDDKVIVLADSAERADEIDAERARKARERAEALLSQKEANVDFARAEAAMRRALARLRVAERARTRRTRSGGSTSAEG
jgi:F-type H+-transporting ATPase subunit epsilon